MKQSTASKSASPAATTPPVQSPVPSSQNEDNTSQRSSPDELAPEVRYQMIAVAAYLRAEQRAFQNGSPEEDWLQAEIEVDEFLAQTQRARTGLDDTPNPSRNQ
jgi:hypothetical protein